MKDVMEKIRTQVKADVRAKGIMNLGELIMALSGIEHKSLPVRIGQLHDYAGDLMSYRGHYDHLAIEPTSSVRNVFTLLEDCESALHADFAGYKGGLFQMDPETPIWADHYGEWSSRAVTAVDVFEGEVVLRTEFLKY